MSLTDIDGVGPAYQETLEDAGYETVESVATADPDVIDDKIERANGETLVANANEEYDGDDREGVPLEPGFTDRQRYHLIRGLATEQVRMTSRNKLGAVDRILSAMADVASGEPFYFTREQASDAYTAASQLEQTYRSNPNITGLVSDMRNVKQFFQDVRGDDGRWE